MSDKENMNGLPKITGVNNVDKLSREELIEFIAYLTGSRPQDTRYRDLAAQFTNSGEGIETPVRDTDGNVVTPPANA